MLLMVVPTLTRGMVMRSIMKVEIISNTPIIRNMNAEIKEKVPATTKRTIELQLT